MYLLWSDYWLDLLTLTLMDLLWSSQSPGDSCCQHRVSPGAGLINVQPHQTVSPRSHGCSRVGGLFLLTLAGRLLVVVVVWIYKETLSRVESEQFWPKAACHLTVGLLRTVGSSFSHQLSSDLLIFCSVFQSDLFNTWEMFPAQSVVSVSWSIFGEIVPDCKLFSQLIIRSRKSYKSSCALFRGYQSQEFAGY